MLPCVELLLCVVLVVDGFVVCVVGWFVGGVVDCLPEAFFETGVVVSAATCVIPLVTRSASSFPKNRTHTSPSKS